MKGNVPRSREDTLTQDGPVPGPWDIVSGPSGRLLRLAELAFVEGLVGFSGKSAGVDCHFLLHCVNDLMAVQAE